MSKRGGKSAELTVSVIILAAITLFCVIVTLSQGKDTEVTTISPVHFLPSPTPLPTIDPQLEVYVTDTGKKYHITSDCSNMKNPIPITINEATEKGYTPCGKCVGYNDG